jgi:Asp-tRNA(Asn)/Glu-tRNA(Gln) amidotransferase A subunit family amidase
MSTFSEYDNFDGIGLADLVRKKQVSATELLETALERVEQRNGQLNALISVFEARARADISNGLPDGPFTGVPFALKDLLMCYAGECTSNGSRFWKEFIPTHTSELFNRYRRAGFVIVGKTNTPELGLSPSTEPSLHGPTRNPWDLTRSAGGSSGGAAAAVAGGILPMAHASDSGGSTRTPASCCGLFGLKPSRGRMPMGPERGESSGGLGTAHAITRSVRDSAALLDASAGPDLGAPYGIAPPARPWAAEVGAPTGKHRVAVFSKTFSGVSLHADCAQALSIAASLCRDLGYTVDEVSPPIQFDSIGNAARIVMRAGVRSLIDARAVSLGREVTESDLEPVTWDWFYASSDTAADYAKALALIHRSTRDLASFQQGWDLILTPTLAQPPLLLGELVYSGPNAKHFLDRARAFNPYCLMANWAGIPAASIPVHWNSAGLPIGVQLFARFGDEATLFRVAAQLEQAKPWNTRRPKLP